MTYVTEQTSEELREHMRSLKRMNGWHDPLADRLWQEIQDQDKKIEQLQRDYAELENEAQRDYQALESQLGKATTAQMPFHAETADGLRKLTIRKDAC